MGLSEKETPQLPVPVYLPLRHLEQYIYLHDCMSTGNSGIYAANSTFKSQKLQQQFQYFISDIQF